MASGITPVHLVGHYARLHGHRQLGLAVCAETQTITRAVSEKVHTVLEASLDNSGTLTHLIHQTKFEFMTLAQKI